MNKDLLLELLGLFKEKDFERLYKLSKSGVWKVNDRVDQQLLDKLSRNPLRYEQLYNAHKAAYPNFKKQNFVDLIEDYILLSEYRKTEHEANRNLQLLNFYNKKRLSRNYKRMLKKTEKNIKNRLQDKDTALLKFRRYEVQATNSRINRKKMSELEPMNEALWAFFVENNLRIVCEAQTQKEILNPKYNILNFDHFLAPQVDTFVKEIYENIHQLLKKSENEKNYNFLKDVIKNRASNISLELLKTIYIHLMNYAIKRINLGNQVYASEYIFYIESLIEQNLFLERDRLDYGRYRNTIIAYLTQEPIDFAGVRDFMEKYNDHLNYIHTDGIIVITAIHSIYVDVFEKKYKEAYDSLHHIAVGKLDLQHKIMFKKLELQLIAILGYNLDRLGTRNFKDKITYFRTFLYKNQESIGNIKYQVSLNFLTCIRKLYSDTLTLKEIEDTSLALTDKIWLKKYLEESPNSPLKYSNL